MCGSRKYPYSGRSLEIPRGREVIKAKLLEEKYEAKLEFPGGRGVYKMKKKEKKKKKPSVGVWMFFKTTK